MPHRGEAELEAERRQIVAAQRDRAAFAPLYERYVDQIFAYAYMLTRNREQAEDVTAATFARAVEELPRFEWRGVPYSAWLYRVAANLVTREQRRRGWLELRNDAAVSALGPPEIAERNSRAAEVRQAVSQLPPHQRQVIVLRFSGGLRNKEIASIMGRSEGAVKLLTHRAMTTLRGRLGAPLPGEASSAVSGEARL